MQKIRDEVLVAEVAEGNISAFEELVNRYQKKLLSFVFSIVWDEAAAQDVVQETFISLYKTIDRIDTEKKFSAYLFSITRNYAISYLRSRKVHAPLEAAEKVAGGDSPELRLEVNDENKRIQEALDIIDNKYKQVIMLYYFDDLSYEEIADRLGVPVNTVRTHLKRAKEALRRVLL
ncbi:RNA polymerase sigma factor [Patescibacteria group bacterium]|nr:RNA polymerase sigma factor [Patescibacteria group bacterium]